MLPLVVLQYAQAASVLCLSSARPGGGDARTRG